MYVRYVPTRRSKRYVGRASYNDIVNRNNVYNNILGQLFYNISERLLIYSEYHDCRLYYAVVICFYNGIS